MSAPQLVAAEVRFLVAHGWHAHRAWIFRGTSTVPQAARTTTPEATIELDAPNRKIYVALDAFNNEPDALQQTSGTPLYNNSAIATTLRSRQPTLWVLLGNGSVE